MIPGDFVRVCGKVPKHNYNIVQILCHKLLFFSRFSDACNFYSIFAALNFSLTFEVQVVLVKICLQLECVCKIFRVE